MLVEPADVLDTAPSPVMRDAGDVAATRICVEVCDVHLGQIELVRRTTGADDGAAVREGDVVAVLPHDRRRQQVVPFRGVPCAPREALGVGALPDALDVPREDDQILDTTLRYLDAVDLVVQEIEV